ncbi:MAG: DNA recombination protein RmuC [Ignavibacteriaceae bacterium]|nr:DNA recombination protein RmuC [Ignavibacteriaceae bacterium]
MEKIILLLTIVSFLLIIYLVLKQRNSGTTNFADLLQRKNDESLDRIDSRIKDDSARMRDELKGTINYLREEISNNQKNFIEVILAQLKMFSTSLENLTTRLENNYQSFQGELLKNSTDFRSEFIKSHESISGILLKQLADFSQSQKAEITLLTDQTAKVIQTIDLKFEELRTKVETKLSSIQENNEKKLEEMRITVDEKLHDTLEKRLGDSFKIVSERLELVHKGLGEMQTLASGVGDLKKVLTNIKTRGNWGEIQLAALIEQLLTPEQYETNFVTKSGSSERVEFAIKLPGSKSSKDTPLLLPIDAKFPIEHYQRLLDAQDAANPELVAEHKRALDRTIRLEADKIHNKYVDPPNTTDFAIMFLPVEGLFAEVLRIPGLVESIQRVNKVVITGPTTLTAVLSSLQMGFRTLAIEKRSGEVWDLLAAVKTEFGKFGDVLEKTQEKLTQASNTLDTARTRTRQIERKLKKVQELPVEKTNQLLDFDSED